ncbi:transcriptional regulator, AraC family [Chryseobacterium arachidis]|uniref:Transcriptional regulator, AraC family n=1 Tax=Chryseobacterium arachidis TaxID=1416778 RepID=A0A1M5MF38_9FLAO|nr:helix-turn-helix domain-containing protein [Chryseobacterium arachidis]SHG75856.1 transcriptional regulator, AraC family [Chryseobacterium arachidis]
MFTTYNITDFPSENSVKGMFTLERFEYLKRPPNLEWPHKHSFYEILWLTSGIATQVIDYHQNEIEPNTLFFISPGQLHQMSSTKDVKGYSITFTEEFLMLTANNKDKLLSLSFLDNSVGLPSLQLSDESRNELLKVIEMMENEAERKEKSSVIIGHLLFVLLNKIQRIADSKRETYEHSNVIRFKNFKKLVEENFKIHKNLQFYSDQMAMTSHRLNQICKQVSGKPAGEFIRERILLEIKRLLIHSDWPIGDISDYLGFEDVSYFSRQFREKEKMTPLAYRREMSEKYQNL